MARRRRDTVVTILVIGLLAALTAEPGSADSAAAELAEVAVAATEPVPAAASEQCIVDSADILGWWKGDGDLVAEIGPSLTGTATFESGVADRAMVLDGDDVIAADGLGTVTDGLTVEAWILPVPEPRTQAVAARWTFTGGEGDDVFALLLTADQQLLWMTDETSALRPVELRVPAAGLFDGQYHHVGATWSTGEVAVYVDGALAASIPSPGGSLNAGSSTQFRLGSSGGPGNPYHYAGGIDEPSVIRRALDASEIAAIHAAGPAGKCEAPVPGQEQAKLTAADGSPDDWFGRSVAIHGDTAVVGAHLDDDRGTDAGAAYVYVRNGFVWTLQAKLTASDAAASDHFGFSVDVDGDTVVVGASQDDDRGLNSGSTYVFGRSGGSWSQQAKLTPATGAPFDAFGRAVSVDGDTVLAGALFHDDGGSNAGAAWVFQRVDGVWGEQAKLVAADRAAGDGFGYAVALDGDRALVGADQDDDGGTDSGSAYVYDRSGTTWTASAKLVAADASPDDGFGYAVALDGDRALLGAYGNDASGTDAGAAYIFARGTSGWAQEAQLVASDAGPGDVFGAAVALTGASALVGAHGHDGAGDGAGAAYVFTGSDGVWSEQRILVGGDTAAGDRFGLAVAVHLGTAIVGAHLDDSTAGVDTGSAYVFIP